MHLYATAMFSHNPLHGIEPKTRSLTNTFRGEERLKNARLHFWGNTWPIVADLDALGNIEIELPEEAE